MTIEPNVAEAVIGFTPKELDSINQAMKVWPNKSEDFLAFVKRCVVDQVDELLDIDAMINDLEQQANGY